MSKANTPIVDDEVRRSQWLGKDGTKKLVQLDSEPRRRKGETRKTIRFSAVEELPQNMDIDARRKSGQYVG